MNKIDKIELENSIKELEVRNNELKGLILAENSLEKAETFDKEFKENLIKITEAQNKLESTPKGEIMTKNTYLETENSVTDFIDSLRTAPEKKNVKNIWKAKLAENGVEITDDKVMLPKRLVSSIESALLEANLIFPVFKLTHVGAFLVTATLDSSDEAHVHSDGADKVEQSATLKVDSIEPFYIYKLQSIAKRVQDLNGSSEEIYATIVAEMTQAIINKAVDLALVEGDGENGFLSVANETDTKKVAKINSATLVDGIEDGVEFASTQGKKFLILKPADRKALLKEVRALNPNQRVRNSNAELADEVGVDEILIYNGTKALKPTVLVDQAFHIDMKDLTKVDAFEYKTNSSAILMESLSAGKMEKVHAGAVITVTP